MSVTRGAVRNSWQHGLATNDYEVDVQGDEMNDIETAIEEVLHQAEQEMNIQADDRVGLAIRTTDQADQEVIIRIAFVERQYMTTEYIMERIQQALNSYQELDTQFTITVTVYPRNRFQNVQGRRSIAKGDLSFFIRNKKSIVEINPERDEINVDADDINEKKNCFAQWIVIGLAHLVEKGELSEIPELNITRKTYHGLVKSGSKFSQRRKYAAWLQQKVETEEPSEESLRRIERKFGVHLVLFSIFHEVQIQYPPVHSLPVTQVKPVICGMLRGTTICSWNHVDYVSKPSALCEGKEKDKSHRTNRFCLKCYVLYTRKQGCNRNPCKEDVDPGCGFCHSCMNVCEGCKSMECGFHAEFTEEEPECDPFKRRTKCDACHTVLFSPKCRQMHLDICSSLFCKRCETCGLKEHRGLLCGMTSCFMCGNKYLKEDLAVHECFLQRKALKAPTTQLAVYDFECALDDQKRHIPYLCTVWFPFGHPSEQTLTTLFPFREVEGDGIVFVFWGLGKEEDKTGVYQFFEFVTHPLLEGYVLYAHNARAYDGILVKYYMSKYMHEFSNDIQRGQKLISMRYDNLGIEFRDSLSFIPSSLRSMSADFGIEELKKGHFPHKLMTVKFLQQAECTQFQVDTPTEDLFDTNFRFGKKGRKEKQEFDRWMQEFHASTGDQWNMKEDAVVYCMSDTLLLGKVLVRFREKLMRMTNNIVRAEDVKVQEFDPLSYLTLPSAMMAFYLSQLLPTKTIAVMDRAECFMRQEAETLFFWKEYEWQEPLVRLPTTLAAHSMSGELVVFRDCYMHGCRHCYGENQRNIRRNMSFRQCFYLSSQELHMLRLEYRSMEVIWQHDWKMFQEEDEGFKQWFKRNRIQDRLPMDPRDAYHGGKVELYKHAFKGNLQVPDFCSEYPAVMLGETYDPHCFDEKQKMLTWLLPIGIPRRLYYPLNYSFEQQRQGFIKCRVLCPCDMYIPFLGCRVESQQGTQSYEVLYGNCRTCMETRQFPCSHMDCDEDRSFVGTWTLVEMNYAQSLGYKVMEVVEVWEYEQSCQDLFRSFIVPFTIEKMKSKRTGLVDAEGKFTSQGNQIRQYIHELSDEWVTEADFIDSPSDRTVAKLAQNSFSGKWGEQPVHKETKAFTAKEHRASRALLTDPGVDILFAQVLDVNGDIAVIEFQKKQQCSRAARQQNPGLIAHITALGRLMLHRLETHLGDDLLYVDTDSAAHKELVVPKYRAGDRTGDVNVEVPSAHHFVACGRKWYSYQLPDGEYVNKLKGFSLKQNNGHQFSSDNLYRHLVESRMDMLASAEDRQDVGIVIDQMLFKTDHENVVVPFKRTIMMRKRAQMQLHAPKRYILYPETLHVDQWATIDTLPFGYINRISA